MISKILRKIIGMTIELDKTMPKNNFRRSEGDLILNSMLYCAILSDVLRLFDPFIIIVGSREIRK
jgi:hypothetical protein